VVEEHVNHLKDGADHEVMMMKIMTRMKIHQHLRMVHLHGHLVVDKPDEVVELDQWISEQNPMTNGILMMIDLVDTKKNPDLRFSYEILSFFSKNTKVNQINNVDGDRMHLCLIVILINVVHKQNEIVENFFIKINSKKNIIFDLGMPEWMDDNNDDENQLSNATFEQDGTFTGSSSLRQNSNEQPKLQSQSSTDETSSRGNVVSDRNSLANLNYCFWI
jgi:hypothetical protein